MTPLLWLALAATVEVAAGEPLAEALARARPGDTIRLGAGLHRGGLGRLERVAVVGRGAGVTFVEAAPGAGGALVESPGARLEGLSLLAGPDRCALRVAGGTVALRDVALSGGACGAFVDGGALDGEDVDLRGGGYGLLLRAGEAGLRDARLRGGTAAAAVVRGDLRLARAVLSGPAREGALSVAGSGSADLDGVRISDPGPTGLSALQGRITGRDVTVAGAREAGGFLGTCLQGLRAEVRLQSSELYRCGGMAAEISGGTLRLDGVDAQGGRSGVLALTGGARGDLQGVVAFGTGPALVLQGTSSAQLRMNTWRADPALWVECEAGARARLLYGEAVREPCAPGRSSPGGGGGAQPRSISWRRRRRAARSASAERSEQSSAARRCASSAAWHCPRSASTSA
jgi:hypothetical protein